MVAMDLLSTTANYPNEKSESRRRRKTGTAAVDLYRGMSVSRACSILKLSEREYRELTEEGLREAFSRRSDEVEMEEQTSSGKTTGKRKGTCSGFAKPNCKPYIYL